MKRRLKYVLNKGYNYYVVCDILKSVTTFAGRNGDYHRYTHVVLTSYAIVGYDETTNTIFSEPLLFPHRHHHPCPVWALLHHLLCPDGTAQGYQSSSLFSLFECHFKSLEQKLLQQTTKKVVVIQPY